MALLFSTPFIDVLVIGGGARWLAAFGVVDRHRPVGRRDRDRRDLLLFRLIGPSRTRLVAQILAAIIGAGFVIALQVAAIMSYGTLSRFAVLTSDAAAAYAPDADSILWWPARAALGDSEALLLLLALRPRAARRRDGDLLAAALPTPPSTPPPTARPARAREAAPFRGGSRQQALRRKEFSLLWRDPWLMSQTPDAAALSGAAGAAAVAQLCRQLRGASTLITPVIVMAAGQLAGGLAWLTISGEDAADLVATAPLTPSSVIRAKIEVVLIAIAAIFCPLVAALAFASPFQAAVTAGAVIISAASATAIQLWFRVQARRSQFRRRQTSSRLATFAEAFSSIGWAATAALLLALPIAGLVSGLITAGLVAITWKFSPRRELKRVRH